MTPPRRSPRAPAALAAVAGIGIALSGCTVAPPAPDTPDTRCDPYTRYGDLSGTTVTVLEDAGAGRIDAYGEFASCTGVRIVHQGTGSIAARVAAGDPPDLGSVPDPATLDALVRTGAVVPAPSLVAAHVAEFYPETFRAAGSAGGTLYGSPVGASVRSLIWYSPREFARRGYAVPTTWPELLALSERIVADGGTPWCVDAADGTVAGTSIADLLEDAVLRDGGPELYDRWVAHEIPFDDPRIVDALDGVRAILRTAAVADGGARDGGIPTAGARPSVAAGTCSLHRQADSYAWPAGTEIGEDGDVFAFPAPPADADADPTALVSSGFVVAFADRREVAAMQAYLASPEWANAAGRPSANVGLEPERMADPVQRLSLGALQGSGVILRFDGSERMPATVGTGSLPRALTAWAAGAGTAETLAVVEGSWPA